MKTILPSNSVPPNVLVDSCSGSVSLPDEALHGRVTEIDSNVSLTSVRVNGRECASVCSAPLALADCSDTGFSSVSLSGALESSNLSTMSVSSGVKFVPWTDAPVCHRVKSSPVWQYFQHFDLNYHPDK